MIRNDYIVKLIERLARVLETLRPLKQDGQYEEALAAIDETFRRTVGLNSSLIGSISDQQLVTMIQSSHVTNIDQFMIVAVLLSEEGEIYEALGRKDLSCARYVRSLNFFLEVFLSEKETNFEEYFERIPKLAASVSGCSLPKEIRLQLLRYYETAGCYSKGEDVLFTAIEAFPGDESVVEEGLGFYGRLLARSDDDLVAGDLPRDEVEDALAELREARGDDGSPSEPCA